ncbi:MAG TPA: hypothetical protein PK999_17580 [Nitrospira sp.]|nr:hypothetical protein [Nitrospira sp.]
MAKLVDCLPDEQRVGSLSQRLGESHIDRAQWLQTYTLRLWCHQPVARIFNAGEQWQDGASCSPDCHWRGCNSLTDFR